jgi:hypothetical protein
MSSQSNANSQNGGNDVLVQVNLMLCGLCPEGWVDIQVKYIKIQYWILNSVLPQTLKSKICLFIESRNCRIIVPWSSRNNLASRAVLQSPTSSEWSGSDQMAHASSAAQLEIAAQWDISQGYTAGWRVTVASALKRTNKPPGATYAKIMAKVVVAWRSTSRLPIELLAL